MIVTEAGTLDLEDADVAAVRRDGDEIRIVFSNAHVTRQGSGVSEVCSVELLLSGVKSEAVHCYVGAGITAPHPNPALPLDFVQVFSYERGTLNLQGMLADEPWYEWEIVVEHVAFRSKAHDGLA